MCGIFGIHAAGEDVANLTYFGLYALQHRGQESAGIAVGDGKAIRVLREMGLVSQVFNEAQLQDLRGIVAIGHCRYSTTGSSQLCNAQPMAIVDEPGAPQEGEPFALAHNGNLVNAVELQESLEAAGARFASTSDSEVIIQLIKRTSGKSWHERIARALPRLS